MNLSQTGPIKFGTEPSLGSVVNEAVINELNLISYWPPSLPVIIKLVNNTDLSVRFFSFLVSVAFILSRFL